MKLRAEQLPSRLEHSLAPVYLIAGAEPLLVQECRDQVIRAAQQQGFAERDLFHASGNYDWGQIDETSANLSLFASRKIVDIRLPGGKPGLDGAKFLTGKAEAADPDTLLIVSCEAWDASSRKSKWASQFDKAGVLIEIWPIKPQELPRWIRGRMQQAGLRPAAGAIERLADLVEGNLLAAQQEIEKLVLLGKSGEVTTDDISRAVADSSRFSSFRLVECALLGQLSECLRVATGLKKTDFPIQAVCGSFYNELTIADEYRQAVMEGENPAGAFRRLRVWQSRQGPIQRAVQRMGSAGFGAAFRWLALIDQQSKGRASGDPWHSLDRMLGELCAGPGGRANWRMT